MHSITRRRERRVVRRAVARDALGDKVRHAIIAMGVLLDRGYGRVDAGRPHRRPEAVNLKREEIVIERRPVNREAGATDIREGEICVPLMEEEAVVDKRAVVKEELVVGKRVVEDRKTVDTEVRREEFDIDKANVKNRDRR